MLQQIVQAIAAAGGSVDLNTLSRQLHVEPSALQGMIEFLVRKGQIKETDVVGECCDTSASCGCGKTCPGPQNCHFVVKLPKTYFINLDEHHPNKENLV
jgi:hypothetical protein